MEYFYDPTNDFTTNSNDLWKIGLYIEDSSGYSDFKDSEDPTYFAGAGVAVLPELDVGEELFYVQYGLLDSWEIDSGLDAIPHDNFH